MPLIHVRVALSGVLPMLDLTRTLGLVVVAELLVLQILPLCTSVVAVAPSAEIVNDSAWSDPANPWVFHILGEVRNICGNWIRDVTVTAYLYGTYDERHVPLAAATSRTLSVFLAPGNVAPFDIAVEGFPFPGTTYMLIIQSLTLLPQPVPTKLTIVNAVHMRNDQGLFEVTGQVINEGFDPSNRTRIIAAFYEAGGYVAYVASVLANPPDIPPETRSDPFKLIVANAERSNRIVGFTLIAESDGYSSVPVTSSPTVTWPPVKSNSSIWISVSPQSLISGENLTFRGAISPPQQAELILRLTHPDGVTFTVSLKSERNGTYVYTFKPEAPGSWTFSVVWYGDANYTGSESRSVTIAVKQPQVSPIAEFSKQLSGMSTGILNAAAAILLIAFLVILLSALVAMRRIRSLS